MKSSVKKKIHPSLSDQRGSRHLCLRLCIASIDLSAQCFRRSGAVYLCTQRRCSVCRPVTLNNICFNRVCSYGVIYMYDLFVLFFNHKPILNIFAVRKDFNHAGCESTIDPPATFQSQGISPLLLKDQ